MSYKEKFDKFGFVIVKGAFDKHDCELFKNTILKYYMDEDGNLTRNTTKNYRDGKECTSPFAFNNENLRNLQQIFNNKKLNNVLFDITENKLIFLHHSDAHVDTVAGKGWHTDAINNSDGRQGKRWKDMFVTKDFWSEVDGEQYNVIRAAFYLQEHVTNQNGLFVVAGSHKKTKFRKELYIGTNVGDVILFDARLQHRGGNIVNRGDHRAAIFWAVGRDNIFSHEHKNAAIARQKYQLGMDEYFIDIELEKILQENDIGY